MGLFGGFDANKCKVNLKLAQTRLKLLKNKKEQLIIQKKREVADLLRTKREEHAQIRVEHVIREKLTLEAYELLDIFVDFLLARFALIEKEKCCPTDLQEAVCTIIWASSRCDDVRELSLVADQFKMRYGEEFYKNVQKSEDKVHLRVLHRLSYSSPDHDVVIKQLASIAKEFDIPWEAPNIMDSQLIDYPGGSCPYDNNVGGGGGGMMMGPGGPLAPPPVMPAMSPSHYNPNAPVMPAMSPSHYDPSAAAPMFSAPGGALYPMGIPQQPPPPQQQPYQPVGFMPPPAYNVPPPQDDFGLPKPPPNDFMFPKPPGGDDDFHFPKPPGGGGHNNNNNGGAIEAGGFGGAAIAQRPPADADGSNRVPDFDELAHRFELLKNKGGK